MSEKYHSSHQPGKIVFSILTDFLASARPRRVNLSLYRKSYTFALLGMKYTRVLSNFFSYVAESYE